jgi:hypothetical protein
MKRKTNQLSERAIMIIGNDPEAHVNALETWARCVHDAMLKIESVFSDKQWQLLGDIVADTKVTFGYSTVPFAVVLTHYIQDTMSFAAIETSDEQAKILATLKKLDLIEATALQYTLEAYSRNVKLLTGKNWWSLRERINILNATPTPAPSKTKVV